MGKFVICALKKRKLEICKPAINIVIGELRNKKLSNCQAINSAISAKPYT